MRFGGRLQLWVAALFILAGLRFALWTAASLEFLIEHTLVDDAFYYLGIARNVWELAIFPTIILTEDVK